MCNMPHANDEIPQSSTSALFNTNTSLRLFTWKVSWTHGHMPYLWLREIYPDPNTVVGEFIWKE